MVSAHKPYWLLQLVSTDNSLPPCDAERREPMRDEDCFWDYAKARCGRPDRCEYRYLSIYALFE